jgi:putative tryptophan/tyrosine transport system substrate-binding protein
MTAKMKRREFITLLGGAAAAWPLAAGARQPSRVRRIGILMPYAKGDAEWAARVLAFKQELAKLGWTDGGNIAFDERVPGLRDSGMRYFGLGGLR